MSEEKKPVEIVFAPGCFDNFEGTQEEMDDLIAMIKEMAASGELEQNARRIDLENPSDEDLEAIEFLNHVDSTTNNRNLQ
jgi:hypothetical protein